LDLRFILMFHIRMYFAINIGVHIIVSVKLFVNLMNEKARWLGMTNTNFTNPHGLNNDDHYSTAYDMAVLMRYAMDNPEFRKISGTKPYKADTRTYSWQNKNKLLTMFYDYSTGGKTGYTKLAGRTLVSSASKNDTDLIVVSLNAPDDWRDHIELFEWGFERYSNEEESLTTSLPVNENNVDISFLSYIKPIYQKIVGMK